MIDAEMAQAGRVERMNPSLRDLRDGLWLRVFVVSLSVV
jgi:hypothetical protein